MKTRAHRGIFVIRMFWLALAGISGCPAQTAPIDWKTDCVGRMQISLPGEAEVAADTAKSWKEQNGRVSRFPDEQVASWSSSSFLGELKISHFQTSDELEQTIRHYLESRSKFRSGGEVQKRTGKKSFDELPTFQQQGVAWKFGDTHYAILRVGSHIAGWTASGGDYIKEYYQTLLTGLRPRPTFDVPKDPGVCLPYLFVKDDGSSPRHIGMTYRLKAHPDITIWLEDASAATIDKNQNPNTFTAKGKANFFWAQRYQTHRGIKSLWSFNRTFKDTTLAGQKGVKTFVELTREDKEQTKDYGYLVAVRGNPEAKEDTPDLMLYVIQDSINATKRDIKPLGKDEFLQMAETIAASVKRREVSAK